MVYLDTQQARDNRVIKYFEKKIFERKFLNVSVAIEENSCYGSLLGPKTFMYEHVKKG